MSVEDIIFDETGLAVKTQAEMTETFRALMRTAFGDKARVDDPDSPEGRIAAILGEFKSDLCTHFQAGVNALIPSVSSGEFLKELIKFNGIAQNVKQYSTVVLTVTANDHGTTIEAGDLVSTDSGVVFAIDEQVILLPNASASVGATATVAGALLASVGTVTTILTDRWGWASVTNAAAALPGNLDETDPAMRARRWAAAVGVGLHHPSKIKTSLDNLPSVTASYVEVNNGINTLPSGCPAGHIHAIVRGGSPADIAAALFGSYAPYAGAGSIAAGIGSYGAQTVHVVDSVSGQEGDIKYDVASDIPIFIRVLTRKIAGKYPASGDADIRAAIVEYFAGTLEIEDVAVPAPSLGDAIDGTAIMAPAMKVPGHRILAVYVGTTADPTDVTVQMTINQFPITDGDHIKIEAV